MCKGESRQPKNKSNAFLNKITEKLLQFYSFALGYSFFCFRFLNICLLILCLKLKNKYIYYIFYQFYIVKFIEF